MPRTVLVGFLVVVAGLASGADEDASWVRGVTVSTQTSGREWATDGFGRELDRLAALGVNWVAIHPYARIRADGEVRWRRFDPASPPEHVARPIREAHARGLSILVHPHLAYWGSPFSWRGAIAFEDPAARSRFFESYGEWIRALAAAALEADGFVVGSELDRLVDHEQAWRALVADVRAVTSARLTYAANWNHYERVPFWDALDAIGVQGYFPLSEVVEPSRAELARGWAGAIAGLRAVHRRTGKPVVLTELGYDLSLDAAREPWAWGRSPAEPERARASGLQRDCLEVALESIGRERGWLRGAFLWKWFVGPAPREDFVLDTPALRAVMSAAWSGATSR